MPTLKVSQRIPEMMSSQAGQTWHGDDGQLSEDAKYDYMVALQEARMNFETVKLPLKHPEHDLFVSRGEIPPDICAYATLRSDTREVLGAQIGERYTPIHNKEAFEFLSGLIGEERKFLIESLGYFDNGRVCFVNIQHAEPFSIKGDDVVYRVGFITSHDGTLSLRTMSGYQQIVCQNTAEAALSTADRLIIKHTESAKDKMATMVDMLDLLGRQHNTIKENLNLLASIGFNSRAREIFLANLIGNAQPGKGQENKAFARQQAIKDAIEICDGTNGQSALSGTMYALLGQLTYYVGHKPQTDVRDYEQSLVIGTAQKLKAKAFDLALTMADRMSRNLEIESLMPKAEEK